MGWPPIARGDSTLLLAPTGSGKTLAAFLVAIDRLVRQGPPRGRSGGARVVYVSPLKALASDIERNLRAPVTGILAQARQANVDLSAPTIDVRTGDTPARDRARMRRSPADILITTPESLYLLLTSRGSSEILGAVETVIVDELHAVVPTKRGAHLALSLERLEALRPVGARRLQRIGLSATQRPLEEGARLLAGYSGGAPRPVTIVDAGCGKTLELTVEAPAPELSGVRRRELTGQRGRAPDARGGWPALVGRVLEMVKSHRATIVFVNSRRVAERLASAVNETAEEELALAHHGSLAREKRALVEQRLKDGQLRAIVATSSLELGIDMGRVDLVVQIEAPPSVASGLQRIGRACHELDGVPRGALLPKHRQDLVACAAAAISMRCADVEETVYPRNPLDVLAQQIVAMCAMQPTAIDELFERVRRAAPFAELPRRAFEDVLDMLSGRYPSTDFAELRPRIAWDRLGGVVSARPGAKQLAILNGGTIPDRGLYGVFAAGDGAEGAAPGRRVGELDEEMVFELRPGEVFLLGASSWRVERITHDRVIVSPAAGEPGKMPFWHGDRAGRARGFGARIGELVRRIAERRIEQRQLRSECALDEPAATALMGYVHQQLEATGEVPTDCTTVIERFVDDAGDWRVVVLCPLGTRVLSPWAIAVAAQLRRTYATVDVTYTDDGMAFRIPACTAAPRPEWFLPSPDAIEGLAARALSGTALFAARFRECATRALLLPRRNPRGRTPLWAQRKRAQDLLAVASRHPTFPIVLETYRECLRDAFDLPGLADHLRAVAERRVHVTTVDTRSPSPFAASVLFSFVSNFIYDSDAPHAERRAHALTIDVDRLSELLGDAGLGQVLDADVVGDHETWLQRLSRPIRNMDELHGALLALGDLSREEARARSALPDAVDSWIRDLVDVVQIVPIRILGRERFIAVEDAALFRDALGVALPSGIPNSLLAPREAPVRDLLARFARTHGPFEIRAVQARYGLTAETLEHVTDTLLDERRIVRGAFRTNGPATELCDRDVLDAIRRKSLAKVRRDIEPVDHRTLARFVAEWQGVTRKRRGRHSLLETIALLQGCPLVASALETEILPARIEAYRPRDLDELCASGEVVWAGIESVGATDGRIVLYLASHEALLTRPPTPVMGRVADTVREVLGRRGAIFFADLARDVGGFPGQVLDTVWQMVWSGEVTNDTLEPLRSLTRRPRRHGSALDRRMRHPRETGLPVGHGGRWSLRASRWSPPTPEDPDKRLALARVLLDRYGVVTRESAQAEGVPGGFAAIYDVLKRLEERGQVRRGHFVRGRGGAQFALPGAAERLRALRRHSASGSSPIVLAASDPASAWGSLIDWPPGAADDRPQRAAGALVVVHEGELLGWLGRRDRSLVTFLPNGSEEWDRSARILASALAGLVDGTQRHALLISSIDGRGAVESELARVLVRAGFVSTARGLLLTRATAQPMESGARSSSGPAR